ncbi:MAG: hypothetical protein CGW95_05830 [Phenylobacterium zucineum]|nr:MAG: hypothetical protein CGW95_05830 [Phenylobacterium zucineum]
MKLIHLSDTHVGHGNNAERLQKLFDDIATLENPQDYTIIHTGDINDSAKPETMDQSLAMLNAMADKGWRIRLVPGNHDCGDAVHVDPADANRFKTKYAKYIFGEAPHKFPVLHLTDECAFIGLDSNEGEMRCWDRLMAEGNLGDQQIEDLNRLLDEPEVRKRKVVLYLHHHPFFNAFVVNADFGDRRYGAHLFSFFTRSFRRLKDAYTLMQCVRDRADMLLFGHQHFGLDYSTEGQRYGIPVSLDGSSSTAYQMDTDRMRYRIIDTSTGKVETRFVALP